MVTPNPGARTGRWPWALALGPLLPVIYWYFGRSDAIGALGHSGEWITVTGPRLTGLASFLFAFALLGVVPALLTRPIFRCSPRELGLGLGRVREGLIWMAIGVPVAIALGYLSTSSPELSAVYPLGAPTLAVPTFAVHALGYLLYYMGFEYHFRGFLLLGLEDRLGAWAANLLQAGIVTLAHLGKPTPELAIAFPASVLFGWIVLRTRSLWYVVAIHWAVGITLDYFLLRG